MENSSFNLQSSAVNYDMHFADGLVSVSMIRKLKECRYDQVVKIVQKHTTFGGGDEMSFRIYFMEDGKEKSFPWVQANVNADSTKACIMHMKLVFPQTVQWIDQRQERKMASDGRSQYDLQFLPLGYAGAGLPRGLQLWIYLFGLGILIFPLVYIVKVLATGGYRVYTDVTGVEIKKFFSKKWSWENIAGVDLTNVRVVDSNNYSASQVMRMKISGRDGKKSKFVMWYDHAIPLLKEMAKHNLVSEELTNKFV